MYGPQNNAETIINNGVDPHSIADGLALDRQRQQDALAAQEAQRHVDQWLLQKRHMEENAARRARIGRRIAIGIGGFIAFAVLQDILLNWIASR